MKLMELTALWAEIEAMLTESGGEVTPAIEERLAFYNLSEADKVDAYAHIVKDLRGRAKLAKEMAKELSARAASLEHQADYLLEVRAREHMKATGVTELQGKVRKLKIVQNGGVAPLELLVEPAMLPEPFRKVEVKADNEKIRAALESGAEYPRRFAYLGERGTSVRVY